ncbi:MAG: glycerol-3-phosphate dehydrogenase/oxidase [Bdellovibrionota bacterium]
MSFSVKTRQENLKKLETQKFDLVIIGGGINGAGIARDAASRGMNVALVESDDFASGTSSRSSKLIHGGIRYLENMEFGLVFEALSERRLLFQMAPHLVHPLRFVLPLYKGGRVGMFMLGLGMWLYDALSMFEAPKMHERLSKAGTKERLPILDQTDLLGSYVYSDAYMDDDRLVIETLRSAHSHGATLVNYCSAVGGDLRAEVSANGEGSSAPKLKRLKVKDELTQKEFYIEGHHFISTVGPWTDIVAPKILGEWKNKMRPSKGVHLTFDRKRVPLEEAVVMISDDEKRIVFAIPRHEMVIIGTTDTDYSGDPRDVHTSKEDVKYLLHVASQYFPGANLKESDILASYSGIRPLVDDGAETESKTSREHLIYTDARNVTFVMGGKYTTYRLIAEHAVLEALKQFDDSDRLKFARSKSEEPLNPLVTTERLSRAFIQSESLAEDYDRKLKTVRSLIDRHGEEAFNILKAYNAQVPRGENELWIFEALHALNETMCVNLRDFYLRRTPLFLARADHGLLMAHDLSSVFQKYLGLTEEQRKHQVEQVHQHLKTEMVWK